MRRTGFFKTYLKDITFGRGQFSTEYAGISAKNLMLWFNILHSHGNCTPAPAI